MADDTLALLRQVENVAALAALRGRIDEQGKVYVMDFDTGGYRSQRVLVRVTGQGPNGKPMLTIYSPARLVPRRWWRWLSRKEAIEILRLNESMRFARYGLADTPEGMLVVVSADMVLETLDADELRIHAYAVAHAADRYEAQFGSDQF
ncbi:MAG: hypothetical protein EBR86_15215 [Planctomycetia bacterium]|jgi:hypothetical protein|nr:hypothetical protein [Planctomycetia bacterium]